MNPDVTGGIEYPIVQVCFTRLSIPQSIDDLSDCFARCMHGAYGISARVDRSWGYLQASHGNQAICFNTYTFEFTMMII
jgi:hypothetical protein